MAKHTAQLGTLDRSGVWAETTASEVAKAAMVEKRMLMVGVVKDLVELVE